MLFRSCPFESLSKAVEEMRKKTPIIIVDFHAEATSEKQAIGAYLDGKVSVVYGTHTHVITADERVQENGTGFICDIGMTGSENSILGMEKGPVLHRFLTQMPARFEPSQDPPFIINGIKVTVDTDTGKAESMTRIQERYSSIK